jgi:CheY-like chemotaxis protein
LLGLGTSLYSPNSLPAIQTDVELRILIVDDSETTRGIIRAIVKSRDWAICGEAASGQDGIRQFAELRPNLVLIDLAMPDLNGFEVARRMYKLNPAVPLVLFTIHEVEGLEEAALKAGITAVVSKAQAWDLVKVIERSADEVHRLSQWTN